MKGNTKEVTDTQPRSSRVILRLIDHLRLECSQQEFGRVKMDAISLIGNEHRFKEKPLRV